MNRSVCSVYKYLFHYTMYDVKARVVIYHDKRDGKYHAQCLEFDLNAEAGTPESAELKLWVIMRDKFLDANWYCAELVWKQWTRYMPNLWMVIMYWYGRATGKYPGEEYEGG